MKNFCKCYLVLIKKCDIMRIKRKEMYQFNKRFSLVAMILCFGLVSGVGAAPSVRVLGSTTGAVSGKANTTAGTKATGTKTGNNIKASVLNANTGVKKSASVKTMSPSVTTMQPVTRASSGRIGTAGATGTTAAIATGTNRFPGIASKTNIQKSYAPTATGTITSTDPNAKGYNMQDMTDRIGVLEEDIDTKATKTELENYYTKEEINSSYYTTAQIDEKLDSINTDISSPYIQALVETVNGHSAELLRLKGEDQYLYDMNSGQKKSVYLVTEFDENALFGEAQGNQGD